MSPTGAIPAPSVTRLQADIREGKFHLVLATGTTDPRLRWIAAHCVHVPVGGTVLHNYYCGPQLGPGPAG